MSFGNKIDGVIRLGTMEDRRIICSDISFYSTRKQINKDTNTLYSVFDCSLKEGSNSHMLVSLFQSLHSNCLECNLQLVESSSKFPKYTANLDVICLPATPKTN